MRAYEATFIFQTNPDALESGKQAVSEILTKASIKTTSEDDIGERKLAYKINKQESGHYILYEIESEPSKIHEIIQASSLASEILKCFIVRKETK